MKEHEFVKLQWYSDGYEYYQYYRKTTWGCKSFRAAGKTTVDTLYPKEYERLTPSSLTPDFTNAKVGDECFSATNGNCIVNDIDGCIEYQEDGKDKVCWFEIQVRIGKLQSTYIFEKDGKSSFFDNHPTLFNSFAQFHAYWAEESLKMKGEKP